MRKLTPTEKADLLNVESLQDIKDVKLGIIGSPKAFEYLQFISSIWTKEDTLYIIRDGEVIAILDSIFFEEEA